MVTQVLKIPWLVCWVRAQVFEMPWLVPFRGGPGVEESLAGAFGRGTKCLGEQFGGDTGVENS